MDIIRKSLTTKKRFFTFIHIKEWERELFHSFQ